MSVSLSHHALVVSTERLKPLWKFLSARIPQIRVMEFAEGTSHWTKEDILVNHKRIHRLMQCH
ncbi:MAG: hypothetical protein K0Q50_1962 [Vampirovibrio sp.]|jgi:hypothetical protein|nr:hypothetical protein [Vampirovibrio sp.]